MESSERALVGSGNGKVREGDAPETLIEEVKWRFGSVKLGEKIMGWTDLCEKVNEIQTERIDANTIAVLAYFTISGGVKLVKSYVVHGDWSVTMKTERV